MKNGFKTCIEEAGINGQAFRDMSKLYLKIVR